MQLELFRQMKKTLEQLPTWFDIVETHAKSKNVEPNLFLTFRLAPDQFAFTRQVQIACDAAKLGAARVCGKEAPPHADTEQTFAELRARVASVASYLGGFTAKDFEGAAARVITQPRWEGKTMTGADYLLEHVVPNVFFHVSQAYAILRHNGVPLGKKDYLGTLTMKAPAA
jgi:uncharacterized protein